MTVTLIAAHSDNGVLSSGGRIPWHLPDDIAHFRRACEGKWILVGRRTWAQMEGWFRPGQTPVVVTRETSLQVPGGYAVGSVQAGLDLAGSRGAQECMVIGGGAVFAGSMPFADRLLLTVVHTTLPGDVFFPACASGEWREEWHRTHPADATHAYAFTIRCLVRSSH